MAQKRRAGPASGRGRELIAKGPIWSRTSCRSNTPTSDHRITLLRKKKQVKRIPNTMDKLEMPRGGARSTPITDPPRPATQSHLLSLPTRTSASPIPTIHRPQSSPLLPTTEQDQPPISFQDLMPHLRRSAPSIVKTRSGSVLSRGFILKTDHYPSGESYRSVFSSFLPMRIQGGRSILI